MKIQRTLALAAATLTLGVPVAAADPDGYQPQLRSNGQPDAVDRYLANNGPDGFQPQLRSGAQPDVVDRYVANALRQADQPDAIARYLRNNPSGATIPVDREPEGFNWATAAIAALVGTLIVLLGVVAASAGRERRRLVLR